MLNIYLLALSISSSETGLFKSLAYVMIGDPFFSRVAWIYGIIKTIQGQKQRKTGITRTIGKS